MVSSNSTTDKSDLGLETSVLIDDSFAKFIRGLDRSLLFDNDFIQALYSIDPDTLTDERFTSFLLSQGPDILLDDSFVQFASIINRDLLSDNSFNAFLNDIGRSALTDDEFTETLLTLDSQVITSGNFTEALLEVDEDMLKSESLQQALRELEPEMLTDDNFASLFADGDLPSLDGSTVSADAIRSELNSINSGQGTVPDDLAGGDQSANSQSRYSVGTNASFGSSSTTASVDRAIADFIHADDSQQPMFANSLGAQNTAEVGTGEAFYSGDDFLLAGAGRGFDSSIQGLDSTSAMFSERY